MDYIPYRIFQEQYVFIHDALCDYITCGDTSVPAHELKAVIATFTSVDEDTKCTGFQKQFAVSTCNATVEGIVGTV